MTYNVNINWDTEAKVWYALSTDIPGFALESDSYDVLIDRVRLAVPKLLELNDIKDNNINVNFISTHLEKVA